MVDLNKIGTQLWLIRQRVLEATDKNNKNPIRTILWNISRTISTCRSIQKPIVNAMSLITKEILYRNTDIILRENTWTPTEYFIASGWGNGYVALPKEHPLYEMDCGEIHDKYDINIHGGLTYSRMEEDKWVIGFDTVHYADNKTNWPKESVEAETKRLKEQVTYLKLCK